MPGQGDRIFQLLSDEWQYKYNYLLPHESLTDKTPVKFRESLRLANQLTHTIEQQQLFPGQQQSIQSYDLTDLETKKV